MKRIQRKRVKGWRMPPNTVSITRPGKWGNPYRVVETNTKGCWNVIYYGDGIEYMVGMALPKEMAVKMAIQEFRHSVGDGMDLEELNGKDLACFCKEGEPCHGDVLIELCLQNCKEKRGH
jgi:hypothetical protein